MPRSKSRSVMLVRGLAVLNRTGLVSGSGATCIGLTSSISACSPGEKTPNAPPPAARFLLRRWRAIFSAGMLEELIGAMYNHTLATALKQTTASILAYTPKASKEELEHWYFVEKKSPEVIARMFGCHPRSVRAWMYQYGIELLGAAHLITGRKAPWSTGPKPPHVIEAARRANTGRPSPTKGSGDVKFECTVCGKTVSDKPYRRKKFCSKECRGKAHGADHWNYRGAADTQRKRLYAQALTWRRKIISRDKKCACCGSTERLRAHHLDSWSKHPEKRFDLDNGATLCHDCHWEFHRATSHKNATKAMYDVWIRTSR